MKEQIEEMRKDLIEIFDKEYEKRRMITPDFTAEKMTAKGYKKQIDGKWIEHPHFNFEGGYSGANYECSNCHYADCYEEEPYCPKCGTKMRSADERN